MGVDVVIRIVGEVTADELAQANAGIAEWVKHGLWSEEDASPLVHHGYDPPNVYEVSTWWRYYGPYYERGPWPDIYRCIRAVQAWLPQCEVFYGGDSTEPEYLPKVTDEFLAEVWAHYNGPDGQAYRGAMAAVQRQYEEGKHP